MEIKLTIDKEKIGQHILVLINGLAINLSAREINVMNELINLDVHYRKIKAYDIPGVELLSPTSRKEVRSKIEGMSQHNLNNVVSSLREKKMLVELNDTLVFHPIVRKIVASILKVEDNVTISFSFSLS